MLIVPTILSDPLEPPHERYKLDADHNVLPADDWADWCRRMAGPLCPRWVTDIPPTNVRVFTFFAGMPDEHGAFFWTTITGGRYQGRSGYLFTYADAEAQHALVVAWLRKRFS